MSSSQPLLSQISLRKRESREFGSMGEALGIPDSGLLLQREPAQVIDPNEPLDKLLLDKRFRQSFMAFADRFCISSVIKYLGIPLCQNYFFASLNLHEKRNLSFIKQLHGEKKEL